MKRFLPIVICISFLGIAGFWKLRSDNQKKIGLACEQQMEDLWEAAASLAIEGKLGKSAVLSVGKIQANFGASVRGVCPASMKLYADFSLDRGPICAVHGSVTNKPEKVSSYLQWAPP